MGCKNAKDVQQPGNKENSQVVPLNDKFVIDQESLIKKSEGDIHEFYKFENRLGEGGFGSVFYCIHNKTLMTRAIKIVNKTKIKGALLESLLNEIKILKSLDHPNIMKLYEYYNDEIYLYVVGELIEGGELFDYICEKGSLDEKQASEIMRQLLSCLSYLHEKNIIHRDIKPENIMMTSKNHSNYNIKLIDFGISVIHDPNEKLSQKLGSPLYVAPEVLAGNYDEKCDEWSAGVIMYTMLTGFPPFQAKNQIAILKAVKSGIYSKDLKEYQILSNEAKDLITNLLNMNPSTRITAADALQHPWFKKAQKKETKNDVIERKNIVENLQKFRAERKIQLAVFYFFAHYLTIEEEKEKLMEMFRALDKDSNGTLSKQEILESLKKNKQPLDAEKMANKIMEYGDLNKNDKIDYSEFVAATIQKEKLLTLEKIETVFKLFDKDGDGKISLYEFKEIFSGNGKIDDTTWKDTFKEADENNDGYISLNEFKTMLGKLVNH